MMTRRVLKFLFTKIKVCSTILRTNSDFDVETGWERQAWAHVDLTGIPESEYSIITGHDGFQYYLIKYEIKAWYLSAATEYCLFFKGNAYGSVTATYD
jgi:hypothetical protein